MAQAQIAPAALISRSVGLPSLIVVEDKAGFDDAVFKARDTLEGYSEAADGVSALGPLSKGQSTFYIELGDKLDSRMETIFVDYAAGIASFGTPTGLIANQFNPMKASLAVIISREALENSYPQLLTYAGATTSI